MSYVITADPDTQHHFTGIGLDGTFEFHSPDEVAPLLFDSEDEAEQFLEGELGDPPDLWVVPFNDDED